MKNIDFQTEKAATDITTGYGASSVIEDTTLKDPYGRNCFTLLIDTLINHKQVYYPLPSEKSIQDDDTSKLPILFQELRKKRLIIPELRSSAERIGLNTNDIEKNYFHFLEWTKYRNNRKIIHEFIKYYRRPKIKKEHGIRIQKDILEYTKKFLETKDKVKNEAKLLNLSVSDFSYAFDAIIRGLVYDHILSEKNIIYFSHPMRSFPVIYNKERISKLDGKWSWGKSLLRLIERGDMNKRPEQISEYIYKINKLTINRNVTWYDYNKVTENEIEDKLLDIAISVKFPLKIRDDICRNISTAIKLSFDVANKFSNIDPLIYLTIKYGLLHIDAFIDRTYKSIPNIKCLRGMFEMP